MLPTFDCIRFFCKAIVCRHYRRTEYGEEALSNYVTELFFDGSRPVDPRREDLVSDLNSFLGSSK